MSKVTVHGASDDLIEVTGAICEEFYYHDDGKRYLAFSEGTVLSIQYVNPGVWELRQVRAGLAEYQHEPHDDDRTTYTDRVTLTGPLEWVVCGNLAHAETPHA